MRTRCTHGNVNCDDARSRKSRLIFAYPSVERVEVRNRFVALRWRRLLLGWDVGRCSKFPLRTRAQRSGCAAPHVCSPGPAPQACATMPSRRQLSYGHDVEVASPVFGCDCVNLSHSRTLCPINLRVVAQTETAGCVTAHSERRRAHSVVRIAARARAYGDRVTVAVVAGSSSGSVAPAPRRHRVRRVHRRATPCTGIAHRTGLDRSGRKPDWRFMGSTHGTSQVALPSLAVASPTERPFADLHEYQPAKRGECQ
jgi:hypothetical protein